MLGQPDLPHPAAAQQRGQLVAPQLARLGDVGAQPVHPAGGEPADHDRRQRAPDHHEDRMNRCAREGYRLKRDRAQPSQKENAEWRCAGRGQRSEKRSPRRRRHDEREHDDDRRHEVHDRHRAEYRVMERGPAE